ncbi:MAG: sodium:solute symporter, partial [Saprospiraceae bacterium]
GLSIIAASVLVPVVMSVWWKRINRWGAMLAVATGFGITSAALLLGLSGGLGSGGAGAAMVVTALALPAVAAVAAIVSLMTPRPEKRMLDVVRDMRVPGGETLLDRELRLQRASRKRPV